MYIFTFSVAFDCHARVQMAMHFHKKKVVPSPRPTLFEPTTPTYRNRMENEILLLHFANTSMPSHPKVLPFTRRQTMPAISIQFSYIIIGPSSRWCRMQCRHSPPLSLPATVTAKAIHLTKITVILNYCTYNMVNFRAIREPIRSQRLQWRRHSSINYI